MQAKIQTSQILNLPEFDYQTPASKKDAVGLLFSSGGMRSSLPGERI